MRDLPSWDKPRPLLGNTLAEGTARGLMIHPTLKGFWTHAVRKFTQRPVVHHGRAFSATTGSRSSRPISSSSGATGCISVTWPSSSSALVRVDSNATPSSLRSPGIDYTGHVNGNQRRRGNSGACQWDKGIDRSDFGTIFVSVCSRATQQMFFPRGGVARRSTSVLKSCRSSG